MRKLSLPFFLALALVLPSSANATISSVFGNDPYGATNPAGGIPCVVQTGANAGIRLCNAATRSTAPSFDGVPIDLNMMFPPDPGSGDNNWPMVMLFHGWGGSKSGLTASTLRWINKGYAVLSITDRGFAQSCGNAAARTAGGAACNNGYIRLLDDRYEARDAQELAGMLADQGVVDPNGIGATGGSYGGGMSLQLAALNNRTMLPNGTLVPWTSPVNGTPMHLAAAAPEAPWSDLAYALWPNGSTLDYAAHNPYYRPGVNRTGVQKQNWGSTLFTAGLLTGYYCGVAGSPTAPTCPNPAADLVAWNSLANTGGPYDTGANAAQVAQTVNEITTYHSGYHVDDSTPPSPILISNGWNDDLFPVDENLRYYNKVRADNPSAHIALWESDLGVHARGQSKAADVALLQARENDWMDYYVKGTGSQPSDGVDTLTTTCPSSAASAGPFHTGTWQAQSPGEVRYDSPGSKTIAATIASGAITTFNAASGGPCGTATSADNASTANYRLDAAPSPGYTIMGSPTVIADYDVSRTNDQVAVRLLDVNGSTESLIARGLWRPKVDGSPVRQVFQLHPQGYFVAPGHVVKLELLPHDSAYGRQNPASPDDAAQHAVTVSDLQLRLPVQESAGAVGGLVNAPADKVLPSGYSFAPGYQHVEPETTIDSGPSGLTTNVSPSFGFSASESYASFECKLDGPGGPGSFQSCDSDSSQSYSNLGDGAYTFSVRATTQGGTTDSSPATRSFTVDTTPPTITITTPADGADYTLNQAVNANFSCEDPAGGSGLASCDGTVANGTVINTASLGSKTFTVNASDNLGNSTSLTHSYRVVYDFSGFFQPVDNPPTLNALKAGSAVPTKFSLAGPRGLAVLAPDYPKSEEIACSSSAPVDGIESTVTAGSSGLSYDATTGQYTYVWKTLKDWAGTCRQLVVKLNDGTLHRANFKFTK